MHLGSMPLTYEIISCLSIKYSLFIQIIPDIPEHPPKNSAKKYLHSAKAIYNARDIKLLFTLKYYFYETTN